MLQSDIRSERFNGTGRLDSMVPCLAGAVTYMHVHPERRAVVPADCGSEAISESESDADTLPRDRCR